MSEQPWSDEAKAAFLAFSLRWETLQRSTENHKLESAWADDPAAYKSPEWAAFVVAAPWSEKAGVFEIPADVVAGRMAQARRKAGEEPRKGAARRVDTSGED